MDANITEFQRYVKDFGVKNFAEKHGLKYRVALAYSCGTRIPKPTSELAHQLIESGEVEFRELYPIGLKLKR